jgi:Tol biopolymer transport system component
VVQWNGASRTTTFVNSTQLTAQIPASDISLAGKASINVVNPAPGGGASSFVAFPLLSTLIGFGSSRALDGSDAVSPNHTFNVWEVNTNGNGATPVTRLSSSIPDFFAPVWSPDGGKLLFVSSRALDGSDAANTNDTTNLWVVNSDGTGATPLTHLTQGGLFTNNSPVWSPDGAKIAFASTAALDGSDAVNTNDTQNIWVVNSDGTGATPLTRLIAPFAGCALPAWSPDGSKLAFQSIRALDGSDAAGANFTSNIWVMKANGSGPAPLTRLTDLNANNFVPVWSPDGTKIAFASRRALDGSDAANTNHTQNIWVTDADGTNAVPLTRLTVVGTDSSSPAWSPDSSRLAFSSQRALDGSDAANTLNSQNIWAVDADGTNAVPLTKLTAFGANSVLPVWSPDGGRITFTSGRALDGGDAANTNGTTIGIANVWIVNADGSAATPLTKVTGLIFTLVGGWRP